MKTAVIALTKIGSELAVKVAAKLDADIYLKQEFLKNDAECLQSIYPIQGSIATLVSKLFNAYDAWVFVMACGIVVRTIAPYIHSKTSDPAILVVDEKGQHVISLLSGHIGGANKLASKVAEITGGTPVITTSTDVNEVVSFDVFAIENDCAIENIENLKFISSEMVNGGMVGFYTDCTLKGNSPKNIVFIPLQNSNEPDPSECKVILTNRLDIKPTGLKTLYLRPRNLVLGIGCKKGTSMEQIQLAVEDFMKKNNRSALSIRCLATIDLKKDEEGLLKFCKQSALKLNIISRTEIEKIEENFTCSEFVKQQVGVASVAEPCAVLSSTNGRLICKKTVYKGITLALTEEEREYSL